jgi:hypothetical protein
MNEGSWGEMSSRRLGIILLGSFIISLLLSATVLSANDPGHDSLYLLLTGDSNVTGNINLTGSLDAGTISYATLLYGQKLDIRANGTVLSTNSRPAVQADDTDLYLDPKSGGVLWLNAKGATTNLVQVGPMTGNAVILNVSGMIYENNSRVCTEDNGLCAGDAGSRWPLAAGYLFNNSGSLDFNESRLNATIDARASGIGDGTGGWTNTTVTTSTALNVNVTNGNLIVVAGSVGIGTTLPTQKLDVNGSGNFSGVGAQLWVDDAQVCTSTNGLCSGSGNSSWNQTHADALYYPLGSNPLAYYNSTTFTNYYPLSTNPLSYYNSTTFTNYYPLSTNPLAYYNSTTLPATPYQSSAAGWANSTVTTTTGLNVNVTDGNFTLILGRIGIGTATPAAKLDVNGSIRTNTNITYANPSTANNTKEVWLDSAGKKVAERYWNGTALVLNVTG